MGNKKHTLPVTQKKQQKGNLEVKHMYMDKNKFEANGRLLSYRVKAGDTHVLTVLVTRENHFNYYEIHCKSDILKDVNLKVNSGINVKGKVISHRIKDSNGNYKNVTFLAATQVTQDSYFKNAFEDTCGGDTVKRENYFRGAVSGIVSSVYENNGYTSIYVRSTDEDRRYQTIRLSRKGNVDVKTGDYIKATYNAVMRRITEKDGKEKRLFDAYITQLEISKAAEPIVESISGVKVAEPSSHSVDKAKAVETATESLESVESVADNKSQSRPTVDYFAGM